jgi:serine/threonine protein kinase
MHHHGAFADSACYKQVTVAATGIHPLARSRCRPSADQPFTVEGQHYVLGGKLGDGAAGLVRKARPAGGATPLAVKFLAPDPKYIDPSAFEDVAHRFRREGERGTHLAHDNLLRILAYCSNDQGAAFTARSPINPFIVMEYVRGRTLESYIRAVPQEQRGVFSVTAARLSIAIQITHALEYLKGKRLVHRDVKPANIFLRTLANDRWRVKLGDFGVMKWGDFQAALATGTLTATSHKGLGTLKYMSPEQAIRPATVTIKSDVWSLGITLFELFTGQILASAHHVYELQAARRARGTSFSRFASMDYRLAADDEGLAELILEMFLAADGRPPIDKIRGRLEWEYSRRFEADAE